MAKASEQEHNGSTLARAGKRKWGYDTSQVDEFLERVHALYEEDEPKISQSDIQNTAFSLQKNGYVISQVDAALHRLENAVVDKQTQWDIAQAGRVAWQAQTQSLAQTLLPRASRAAKQRFADGPARKPSYDRKQVDRFVDQIVGKLNRELGFDEQPQDNETAQADSQITASSIANVIFTQRKGKHGYAERQVDAYLNRAIQVFSRLESYARLEESLDHIEESRDAEQQSDAFDAATQALHPVVPLFPQATVEGQREEEHPEFGYVSQYSATQTLADSATQAQQQTSIFDAAETTAGYASNVSSQDIRDAASSTSSLANSESSSFEALRRQEQAIFNQDTQSKPSQQSANQQFSVEKASQSEAQSVSQSSAPQPAIAQPPVFAPANFEFSTQQPQSQRNDEAKYREEPEKEGERTTSFTPIFDESDFGAASAVQHPTVQQHDATVQSASVLANAHTEASDQETVTHEQAAEDQQQSQSQEQGTNSTTPIDDDYFTKLLGMDSIESTDFHIPNLVFPSADTPEEDAAQQRLS